MYHTLRPLLFRLEAERAHNLGMLAARLGQALPGRLLESQFEFEAERLGQDLWGLRFGNPIGIAAGFDKNARLLPFWRKIGCGFAEIGSVSARPSKGNPKPRAFRLIEDEALINRMGLNNQGAERIARRLARRRAGIPVVLSLAKTHDPAIEGPAAVEDFARSFRLCAPHSDVVVLNLSCPNTAEGKTFEDPNTLDDLLASIMAVRSELGLSVPVLLKLSPPVADHVVLDSEVDEIVAVARARSVHGFVASNTDPARTNLLTSTSELERIGPGGLSGRPLRSRSTELIRYLYRRTEGTMPIVGVGGVSGGQDAYDKIRAGASLVQLYTAMVYEGPGLIARIKRDLNELLERDGFASVSEAVGSGHRAE